MRPPVYRARKSSETGAQFGLDRSAWTAKIGAWSRRQRRSGGETLSTGSLIYWFFRRKAKIAFLALMIYAALC